MKPSQNASNCHTELVEVDNHWQTNLFNISTSSI
jgi:hypothetical protein